MSNVFMLVWAEQGLFPPLWLCYIKYTYSMYQRYNTKGVRLCICVWACVFMRVAILPSVPKAVSADVLLYRLMADYDIKCLWALISDSPKVRGFSYPHWPLLNAILMDAQRSSIQRNRETCTLCILTHAHTCIYPNTHRLIDTCKDKFMIVYADTGGLI